VDNHERAEFNKILRILEKHWGEKLTPDFIAEIAQMYSTYRGRYELLELIAPYEKEELPKPPTPHLGPVSNKLARAVAKSRRPQYRKMFFLTLKFIGYKLRL
jgi:hypothetical protein